MQYSGKWRIMEMEMWNSNYFDMEVEAYIKINADGSGEFQFGLVHGYIDGLVTKHDDRFEFTWDGNDECEEASGSGWLQLKDKDSLDGHIELHTGDESDLVAKRMINS